MLETFNCDWCGGIVTFVTGTNRTRNNLVVPDDFELATCENCLETYVTLEEGKQLEEYNESRDQTCKV